MTFVHIKRTFCPPLAEEIVLISCPTGNQDVPTKGVCTCTFARAFVCTSGIAVMRNCYVVTGLYKQERDNGKSIKLAAAEKGGSKKSHKVTVNLHILATKKRNYLSCRSAIPHFPRELSCFSRATFTSLPMLHSSSRLVFTILHASITVSEQQITANY